MIEFAIRFVMSNFTLTFFVIALLVAGVISAVKTRPWKKGFVANTLLSSFIFFTIGVSYFYNFVIHVFFGEMAASFIGWENSPFQAEVGYASLGFSVVGFLAFRGGLRIQLAAIAATACFCWGAAIGHIVQIVESGNYAPGNAGVMLYSDILLPVIGFTLLYVRWHGEK